MEQTMDNDPRVEAVARLKHQVNLIQGHPEALWSPSLQAQQWRTILTALTAADGAKELRLEWRDGPPPKPWSEEWFIALTTYGDRVVLRALPEEYTYNFETADETYIKAEKIAKWMQFPDSEYIAPDGAKDREIAELLREETRERVGLQLANAKLRKALAGLLDATDRHVFGDECLAEREEARTTLEGGPAA
jgi:hypothetical protein